MMEYILLLEFLVVGVVSIVYDYREYRVPNRLVAVSLLITVILRVVDFVCSEGDGIGLFMIQILIAVICSVYMYILKIWGGGDTKLFILLSLMIPCPVYEAVGYASLFYVLIYVYSIAFIYILIESVVLSFREEREAAQKKGMFRGLGIRQLALMLFDWAFFVSVISVVQYVCSVAFPQKYSEYPVIFLYVNVFLVLLLGKIIRRIPWIAKVVMIICFVTILCVRSGSGTGTGFSVNPYNYLIAFTVLALRLWAARYNYKTVSVDKLQPGMILSAASVLSMTGSRVKGLPQNMSEDMSARLDKDEVESIRRWAKTPKGKEEVVIVKKIPFVVFMVIGFSVYIIKAMIW